MSKRERPRKPFPEEEAPQPESPAGNRPDEAQPDVDRSDVELVPNPPDESMVAVLLLAQELLAKVSDDDGDDDKSPWHAVAEDIVLPGEAMTPAELWERTDVDPEVLKKLWRTMGFPEVDETAPILRPQDERAMRTMLAFVQAGGLRNETVFEQTRNIGRSVSRIADAQVSTIAETARRQSDIAGLSDDQRVAVMLGSLSAFLPSIEELVNYLYRRHVLAAVQREIIAAEDPDGSAVTAVGFADLVGFSVSSLQLSEGELARLLERFEDNATDVVSRNGGRVVKMIGDEVMFVADSPEQAADIALTLVERASEAGPGGELRAGIAFGPALKRQGDYFGPTVNLASRLVGIARQGTVIADDAIAEAIEDVEGYRLKRVRGRDLKGVGYVDPSVVRRA